jgi:mannose-1-phosphate guanylyltransferase
MIENAGVLKSIWSVVFAGGEGARTREWTQATSGASDQKQFCFLNSNRSMFQLTLDRARQISCGGGILAVTISDFEPISKTQIDGRRVVLLVQPANRGTTGAIYLALSHIMARDPNACVAIFPSDHYVEPEPAFVDSIRRAIEVSVLIPSRLVLVGATPDRMASDYGFLVPGDTVARYGRNRLSTVAAFRERPPADQIRSIHRAGGLWNTFIIIGRAQTFFEAGATCIPGTVNEFYRYVSTIDSCEERAARVSLSEAITQSDFSKDVLQNVPDRLAVFQLTGLHWSDRGQPERIMARSFRLNSDPEQSRPPY